MSNFGVRLSGTAVASRYKASRLMGLRARTPREAAARVETIEPGGRSVAVLKPIIADRHVAKIRDGFDGRSRASKLVDLALVEHGLGPVEAYTLADAFVLGDAIYKPRMMHGLHMQSGRFSFWKGDAVSEMDRAAFAGTYAGSRWFGHFVHDDLPMQVEIERHGPPVIHHRPVYSHEPGYRAIVGLATPERFHALRAKELVMLSDVPQSLSKTRRYHLLRDRIAAALPPAAAGTRLFIKRGATGSRRCLLNEDEIADRFARDGFRVISPSHMPLVDVLAACVGATLIVGVEGSHMVPVFFAAARDALVVYLNPPTHTTIQLPTIGSFFGQNAAIIVADAVEGTENDFTLDIDDLLASIDEAQAEVARDPRRATAFLERVGFVD